MAAAIVLLGLTANRALAASPCPCSLFSSSPSATSPTVPSSPVTYDPGSLSGIELGLNFYTDTAGYIDGVRFYKSSQDPTATHTVDLWSAAGALLGQATTSGESASGWQEADFATPVAVTANTDYVAGYFNKNSGYYYATQNFFTAQVDNAPLHAPASSGTTPNGPFAYATTPTFPGQAYNASNYYVDVVYTPTPLPATVTTTAATSSAPKGTTDQLTSTAGFGDGTTSNITSSATWTSSNPAVATVSSTGLLTAVSQGTTTVTSSEYGVTSSGLTITVGPPALTSIATSAATSAPAKGTKDQLTATGGYTDGSTSNISSSVTWTSSNPSVATVSSTGLLTAVSQGTTNVSASENGVTSTPLQITVGPAALTSIATSAATSAPAKGTKDQLTATGGYTDGSTSNISSSVTWTSSNPSVATVSSTGLLTAVSQGTTNVSASENGVTSTPLQITVGPAALVSIAVTDPSSSLPTKLNEQLTATGTYTDGSTQNLTSKVTWTSSNAQVATIGVTGSLTATGRGTDTVTASLSGISGHATITGLAPVLLVSINPAISVFIAGQSQQLQSQALLTDGTTFNATPLTTWSVTPGLSVSSSGVVSSNNPFVGVVTATLQSSGFAIATVIVEPSSLF